MLIQSYKHYLNLLEKKPRVLAKKVLITTFSLTIITVGFISAVIYYRYNKEAPIRAQDQYLQIVSGGFLLTKQSLEEILVSFQIAGAKTQTVDKLKDETQPSDAFSVSLDDTNKIIAKIAATRENVLFQNNQLKNLTVPPVLLPMQRDLQVYYEEIIKILDKLDKEHRFARELLIATGPDFYFPTLSDESLWKKGTTDEIIAYYEKIKIQADQALSNLSKLQTPEDFKPYVKTHLHYLELLVNTSNRIIETLSQAPDQNPENPTQLEKGYQILTSAKRENESQEEKILSQRLELTSTKENLEKLAAVKLLQNSLESKFADFAQDLPKTNNIINKLLKTI